MPLAADRDVVLAKVSTIRRCATTVGQIRRHPREGVESWIVDDVTVLNLQRAAQACLGLASHVIAANGWELPRSAGHAFEVLAAHGVIGADLMRVMRAVAGFRNIAVHDYAALDMGIVEAIARDHLDDLEVFAEVILDATLR